MTEILEKPRGPDNALNGDTIAICGLARDPTEDGEHPSRLDIPTPRCDRIDAAVSLRRNVYSLNGSHTAQLRIPCHQLSDCSVCYLLRLSSCPLLPMLLSRASTRRRLRPRLRVCNIVV